MSQHITKRDIFRRKPHNIGPKKSINRRILFSYTLNGREHSYHATKGWREHRA